jgi:hypothetical protein
MYGIPGVIIVGNYTLPHYVPEAARLVEILHKTEEEFYVNLDKVNVNRMYSAEGKAQYRGQLGDQYVERVGKIAEAHIRSMGKKVDEMKLERTITAKPIDSATEKWIWSAIREGGVDDANEALNTAVENNDELVYEAIMRMPKPFQVVSPSVMTQAQAQWEQKNLAGATQEEIDIRKARAGLQQEVDRLPNIIRSECGVVAVDPLLAVASGDADDNEGGDE